MSTYVPPLATVSGARDIASVHGGFGGSAMLWRGACYGCGAEVACRPDCPQPECTGCGRARHGVIDGGGRRRFIPPTISALGPHRVLVTGSRDWDDVATLHAALDALWARYGRRLIIVHGHCKSGADAIADAWALAHGIKPERWEADWSAGGLGAGPVRNAAMVASRPAEVLAFIRNASRGASGCATLAAAAGLPVERYIYGVATSLATISRGLAIASGVTILRAAAPLALDDPALPRAVRGLAQLAAREGWPLTLTAAVASDDRGMVASVAVRVQGLGYAVYARREDGWEFRGAVVADPYVRRANVGQFAAALQREVYVPPAPKAPAAKVACPGCAAEVSVTAAGAIYANHKCKINKTEGRS